MKSSNITTLGAIVTTETKLMRMQDLDKQIDVLQAEFDMLKKEVINEFFWSDDEYRTSKGLLLATYKGYTERRFNGNKFQIDFPDIYDGYKEKKVVYKFSLK